MISYIFYIVVLSNFGAREVAVKNFDSIEACAEFFNTNGKAVSRNYYDEVGGRVIARGCKPANA